MKKVLFFLVLLMVTMVVGAQKPGQVSMNKAEIVNFKKVASLPKSITDNIHTEFAGFTVKEAATFVADSLSWYEVIVVKGAAADTLIYNKDGKFVSKVSFGSFIVKKR